MKKLIFVLIILALVFTGCDFLCPPEEVPEAVESPIDCNGHYSMFFNDFQLKDWANCDYFAPKGIYWANPDGRLFFLCDLVTEVENENCENGIGYVIPDPIAIFGKCPVSFGWELVVPEPVEE